MGSYYICGNPQRRISWNRPQWDEAYYCGVVIYRIFNGKIVEAWVVEDPLDSLKQLGLIEYTEKGKQLFPEDVK